MEQRITLKCWNPECRGEYSLYKFLNPEEQPKLLVECPFCEHEGVVDISSYEIDVDDVYLSGGVQKGVKMGSLLELPEIMETTPPPIEGGAGEVVDGFDG